jgi:RHS repeat-associated protein
MRVDGTLYYVLKDHLGSASVVTDASGNVVGEQRYYPFGETRLTTGTMYTDKLFTGQREISGLGIYHYGARFYSPKSGRFLSADTIVPGAANPQNLNRFSYTLNNPLKYTDPSGHWVLETDDPVREQRRNANRHQEERERNRRERERANGGNNNPLSLRPSQLAAISVSLPIPTLPSSTGTPPNPNWGTFIVGEVVQVAGLLMMFVGALAMISAYIEINATLAAAPTTFGLSALIGIIHAPAEFAVGALIFGGGAFSYGYGAKLEYESGVPSMVCEKISSLFK